MTQRLHFTFASHSTRSRTASSVCSHAQTLADLAPKAYRLADKRWPTWAESLLGCVLITFGEHKQASKQATMAHAGFAAAVLIIALSAAYASVAIRGPLQDALVDTLQKHPSVRKVTIGSPELRRGVRPKHVPGRKKPSRRRSCRWTMRALVVGDYDADNSFVHMTTDDCGRYNESDWAETFPCVFDRETLTTTCNGPLPRGTSQQQWQVGALIIEPQNIKVPRSPAPSPRPIVATPFTAEPTLDSLGGLGLAKTIQCTGVYSGSVKLESSWYGGDVHVGGECPELYFGMDFAFDNAFTANGSQETRLSWYAWVQGDKLIVDMLYVDEVAVPTPPDTQAADAMRGTRKSVSYSANDLTSSDITIDGNVYKYRSNEHGRSSAMEPRLCPVLTLATACSIASNLAETDKEQLGNITGFYLTSANRDSDHFYIAGNVLGTKGLLNVNYRASVLDRNDPAWVELPMYTLSQCAQRVYDAEECLESPASDGPQVGPLVYAQSYDLEGQLHDIRPVFIAF